MKQSHSHDGIDGAKHKGTRRGCAECHRTYQKLWRDQRWMLKPGDLVDIEVPRADSLSTTRVTGKLIGPAAP